MQFNARGASPLKLTFIKRLMSGGETNFAAKAKLTIQFWLSVAINGGISCEGLVSYSYKLYSSIKIGCLEL